MNNEILRCVEVQRETLDKICELAKELPVNEYHSYWLSYDTICIRIAHSLDAIRAFRKSLPIGWKCKNDSPGRTMDDGAFVFQYVKDGIEMNVYTSILKGQNCKRVKVSEKTVPIYRIVCE